MKIFLVTPDIEYPSCPRTDFLRIFRVIYRGLIKQKLLFVYVNLPYQSNSVLNFIFKCIKLILYLGIEFKWSSDLW